MDKEQLTPEQVSEWLTTEEGRRSAMKKKELSPAEVSEWLTTLEGRIWLDSLVEDSPSPYRLELDRWVTIKTDPDGEYFSSYAMYWYYDYFRLPANERAGYLWFDAGEIYQVSLERPITHPHP